MSDVEKAIRECREAIDRTDEKLLELLNERARYNAEIGRLKATDEAEVFVASRELEIFERLVTLIEPSKVREELGKLPEG